MKELDVEYCPCGERVFRNDEKTIIVNDVPFHRSCWGSIEYNAGIRKEDVKVEWRGFSHCGKVTYIPRREVALS